MGFEGEIDLLVLGNLGNLENLGFVEMMEKKVASWSPARRDEVRRLKDEDEDEMETSLSLFR